MMKSVALYNINGTKIGYLDEKECNKEKLIFDISHLSNGFYFLSCSIKNGTIIFKKIIVYN